MKVYEKKYHNKKNKYINRNILKVQISESDIVELGGANILRKQGIQNKRQLSLRVQQSDDTWGKSCCKVLWSPHPSIVGSADAAMPS